MGPCGQPVVVNMWVQGPYSINFPDEAAAGADLILIGTGTGIAPLIGILMYTHTSTHTQTHMGTHEQTSMNTRTHNYTHINCIPMNTHTHTHALIHELYTCSSLMVIIYMIHTHIHTHTHRTGACTDQVGHANGVNRN